VRRQTDRVGNDVDALVKANTGGRDLGFLGESGVGALALNLSPDKQYPYSPWIQRAVTGRAAVHRIRRYRLCR